MRSWVVPLCVLAVALVLLAASAVGGATRATAIREVAARDLGCPSDSVQVKHVTGHIYSASGCGSSVDVACKGERCDSLFSRSSL